ncbi:hypothetical protein C9374_004284 [Naegleria lovaniensis]|uniref:RRM domain-containing protein n=1 Tax=Naegleria lovaniensis TaxID=51637 RepID=A0AA88KKY9_NAELO|nr:uncharacterized protein C9374_004284 [Naegleria lovaniensis]KAG2383613.1 hypothetical protein C9374_004284 [Naegleria lovaniensis]
MPREEENQYSDEEQQQEIQNEDDNQLKRKRGDDDQDQDEEDNTKKQKYDYDARAPYTVMLRNLPYSTTEDQIRERLSSYGAIVRVNIPVNDRNQSRGYGFVEFEDVDSAQKVVALKAMNMDGRDVALQQSKARDEFSGRTNQVFVGNLPDSATKDDIRNLFQDCGDIEEVRMPEDNGKKKGFAFVQFTSTEPVKDALKKDGIDFQGVKIKVNEEKSTRMKQRKERGGRFDDRRGGDRRGGGRRFDDRRGGRFDDRRRDDRGGRFDDRRGGDRRGGYDERRRDDRGGRRYDDRR